MLKTSSGICKIYYTVLLVTLFSKRHKYLFTNFWHDAFLGCA